MPDAAIRLAEALADRYRIEREIGAGGMATVYLALDLRHDRQVALKVLRPELAASLGNDRFFREIQVAARLQHPNILPLHDSGEASGFLYFVMPYVEGESLRQRLQRTGELPVHDAVKILVEVVDALAYAHSQGVVHRDIKPDNVMLSGRHALVTDFGVAKAVSEATGRQQLTTAGVALGTPAYMAPEQAAADPHLDHRVDIYAVGIMGYELLAGRPPFVGMTSQQVLAAHVTQRPEPLSTHRPACPPALEAVLMRCLEKRAADRWQTAEELLLQLEPLATPSGGMTPTQTRPVSALPPAPARPRWLVPVLAVALLTLVVGAWFGFRRPAPVVPRQLERTQLTFTGNALAPALSQDGRRLAYTTRQCDSTGHCTLDLVVQDMAGAGKATILRGLLSSWWMWWTADARYLVLMASFGSDRWGVFSVPSLGGEPRFLGCCSATLTQGDTVLITQPARLGDSVAWLRWVSPASGVVYDSLRITRDARDVTLTVPLYGGRLLAMFLVQQQSSTMYVGPRDGRVTDSVIFVAPATPPYAQSTPDGRSVRVLLPRRGTTQEYDLVRYGVSSSGRIAVTPDTVARQLNMTLGGDVHDGAMVFDYGPTEFSFWALRRDTPGSMQFTQRRLALATAMMYASLTRDGSKVLLVRGSPAGDSRLQLSIMPFDSGPEVALGQPLDLVDWDWSQDGRSVVVGTRRGPDTIAVSRLDVASGRLTPITQVPSRDYLSFETVSGGGLLLLPTRATFRRIGVPGLPDSTFPLPPGVARRVDPSPDGRAFVEVGWDANYDSILVHRVSLVDGSATRLAAFGGEGISQPAWLDDGTIIVPINETAWTQAWYRIPAGGGPAVRLGSPPRVPGEYRISADGRRAVARSEERHTDIYMIRNYGELLKTR